VITTLHISPLKFYTHLLPNPCVLHAPSILSLFDHYGNILEPNGNRDGSVSIASDYELYDRAIEDRSPAEARDFSSNLCVHTGSGAHPISCTMGTGSPFPGGKARPGRDVDHSPHLVPRSWMSRSYTSSFLCASIGVLWDCFTFIWANYVHRRAIIASVASAAIFLQLTAYRKRN
jgi:hypothetical protein